MSASLNKVQIIGNIGRIETKYNASGAATTTLSVATTSRWKDKDSGERREETEWHRIVCFNRLAEIVGNYGAKGRSVYIEGRLKTSKFQDKATGEDRFSTQIIADVLQFLDKGNKAEDADASTGLDQPDPAGSPANMDDDLF
ncbi:single-stranded DNA-binding protein [Bordetella sp. FB-8]|uniref:single-stranded DNA-binding protein n=1 Tax=Bordetella sp. FB-8 TaxID=1159870 RepID=UPI00037E5CE8|nr:single-stranded DNA-binding protein [Bordetella sp. FB-8]